MDELDEFIVEKVEKSDKTRIFELKEEVKRLKKEKNINWENKFNTLCDEIEQRPLEQITDKKKRELMFTFGIRAVAEGKYGEGFFDALNYIKSKIDIHGETFLLKIWKSIENKTLVIDSDQEK